MKNWKKWLVAGCMAALLGIGTMGTTAMAMGGGGVDRGRKGPQREGNTEFQGKFKGLEEDQRCLL